MMEKRLKKRKKKAFWIMGLAIALFSGVGFVDYRIHKSDLQQTGLSVGDKAPEIALPNPEGEELKLSDLKGKIVLIDFWASWCRPCRQENPNLVRAYKKYNKAEFENADGFEIFSVSLDRQKGAWKSAIKADNLEWPWHVSDLKFWQSEAARKYNVNSIPNSFLIDEKGVIIAKGLRGRALDAQLSRLSE